MSSKTTVLRPDGTKVVLGRKLTKAEKKTVKRQVTGVRLAVQARKGNAAVTARMDPTLYRVITAKAKP